MNAYDNGILAPRYRLQQPQRKLTLLKPQSTLSTLPFLLPSLSSRSHPIPLTLLPSLLPSYFSPSLPPADMSHNSRTQIKFEFSPEYRKRADEIIQKYPTQYKKAAVIPLLDLGQVSAALLFAVEGCVVTVRDEDGFRRIGQSCEPGAGREGED